MERQVFKLYIALGSAISQRAITNLEKLCRNHFEGQYETEVIDILSAPEVATENKIIAIPTLVRNLPLPRLKIIGDLSDPERLLAALNLSIEPKGGTQ